MKTSVRPFLFLFSILFAGSAFAQAHTLTYNKKSAPVDSVVKIHGDSFVISRIPVRDFESGDKYAIVLAAPMIGPFEFAQLTAVHGDGPGQSNMQIDSFPAQVTVSDALSYQIVGTAPLDNTFSVTGT